MGSPAHRTQGLDDGSITWPDRWRGYQQSVSRTRYVPAAEKHVDAEARIAAEQIDKIQAQAAEIYRLRRKARAHKKNIRQMQAKLHTQGIENMVYRDAVKMLQKALETARAATDPPEA